MGYYAGCVIAIFTLFQARVSVQGDTVPSGSSVNEISTCRPEFERIKPHTMCLKDSDRVVSIGISDEDKKIIVDYHNKVRREAQPIATDLTALVWDDNLAEVAQKLAMQCEQHHDLNEARRIPSYGVGVGQNIGGSHASWLRTVTSWFEESFIYKYGHKPKDYISGSCPWAKIGHYTMMVSDKAHRVGCGFAVCKRHSGVGVFRLYICNYGAGQHGVVHPYKIGPTRCSDCPDSCKDGLCDCNGLLCLHSGKLDRNKCTCTCNRIYGGADCSVLTCPKSDVWWCKYKTPDMCHEHSNYPFDCPYMCGKCKNNTTTAAPTTTTTTTTTVPTTTTSTTTTPTPTEKPTSPATTTTPTTATTTTVTSSASTTQSSKSSTTQSGSDVTPENKESTCRPEFAVLDQHTMCFNDSDRLISSGVSDAEKKTIVDFHNKARRETKTNATDLTVMVWDDKIAEVAQKLANQCRLFHDKNRKIPSYGVGIGQNLVGTQSWSQALHKWFDESEYYEYGLVPKDYLPGPNAWAKVGHYTMMVSNRAHRIGCGFSRCRRTWGTGEAKYYVCNYAAGQLGVLYPFTEGDRCSACPESCNDGLCDCKGLHCLHSGGLNINTCTCNCRRNHHGEDCRHFTCPEKDVWWCNNQPIENCKNTSNYRFDCPHLCGRCPVADVAKDRSTRSATTTATPTTTTTSTTTTTTPPPFVSPSNCTFVGQRATAGQCKTYGKRGSDMNYCSSRGGGFTCEDCGTYNNVKTDYCPVMCGLCDPPCGKICVNSGVLNPDTCKCECDQRYTGDLCEIDSQATTPVPTLNSDNVCPFNLQKRSVGECRAYGKQGSDTGYCQSKKGGFTCEDCKKYYNVKFDFCPVMCGICDPPCGMVCVNGGVLNPDTCTCRCAEGFSGPLCETSD